MKFANNARRAGSETALIYRAISELLPVHAQNSRQVGICRDFDSLLKKK